MLPSLAPPSPFGEIAALLTSAFSLPPCALQPFLHHGDGSHRVVWIAEVDLDVVLRPSLPRAILGKAVA